MNHLVSAVECLAASIMSLASVSGTYTSISGESAETSGSVVLRDYEVFDDDGALTQVTSSDWLFRASDLTGLLPPKPGDVWAVTDDTVSQDHPDYSATYEAMLLGKRPCFEPHDASGVLIVVHTKRVYGS